MTYFLFKEKRYRCIYNQFEILVRVQVGSKMSKDANNECEINKSLDELVNEDQSLSRHYRKRSNSKQRDRDDNEGRYE